MKRTHMPQGRRDVRRRFSRDAIPREQRQKNRRRRRQRVIQRGIFRRQWARKTAVAREQHCRIFRITCTQATGEHAGLKTRQPPCAPSPIMVSRRFRLRKCDMGRIFRTPPICDISDVASAGGSGPVPPPGGAGGLGRKTTVWTIAKRVSQQAGLLLREGAGFINTFIS